MKATWFDDIPILFEPGDWVRLPEGELGEFDRALIDEFGSRVEVRDYDGEYPLRAHLLIVSLAKLEEASPVIDKVWLK